MDCITIRKMQKRIDQMSTSSISARLFRSEYYFPLLSFSSPITVESTKDKFLQLRSRDLMSEP